MYIYTPVLHIHICIHPYYHYTACVLEMSRIPHIHTCTCPPTILCNYPPPPPPPPITLLYTYNTCIKSTCISCAAVIHCSTQAGFPPKILILDRTLVCTVCMYVLYVCTYVLYVSMYCMYVCTVCMYVLYVCMYVCAVCKYVLYVCMYVCTACMYVLYVSMYCMYV